MPKSCPSQQSFYFDDGSKRFVAVPSTKLQIADVHSTATSFVALAVQPQTIVSRFWLETNLRIIFDRDDPLPSLFTNGILLTGASAAQHPIQEDAQLFIQERKAWQAFHISRKNEGVVQGLYLSRHNTIYQALRIHDDVTGSFLTALVPNDPADSNPSFQPLAVLGSRYQTLGIAVPARAPKTTSLSLDGLRFAVKDSMRFRGLRTSLCNAAYLTVSTPSDNTAAIVLRTIAAGARLVGLTKLSSMIGKEDPTEATDYHAPFNPRGHGYQSPAGSSSGSAAAVAAYSWLDFAIGTDTTGSARRPALVNGVFQLRPTHRIEFLDGIITVFEPWDVPAVFARDIKMLKPVLSAWYQLTDIISNHTPNRPPAIIYPLDYFPVKNGHQMQCVDAFVADLAKSLNAVIQKVSIASTREKRPPEHAGGQSIQDYLQDVFVNANFHDYYYNSTNDFRSEYEKQYHKEPYVIPFIAWKWELGKSVTKGENEEAKRRLEVYRVWFLEHIMQQDTQEPFLIMPISNVEVNYRDVPPSPVARPTGFDPLILSPILGAPDIVVPIGEYEYESRVSGRKERLPVAVDIVALPDSDFRLIDVVQCCLEMSKRPMNVNTGIRLFHRHD